MKHSLNFKEINKLYPNAFREWLGVTGDAKIANIQRGLVWTVITMGDGSTGSLSGRETIRDIPYYFDTMQIKVLPDFEPNGEGGGWTCKVITGETRKILTGFPDRNIANINGIYKAFEIRELQLLRETKNERAN